MPKLAGRAAALVLFVGLAVTAQAAVACPAAADDGRIAVAGEVLDAGGKPVEGATVISIEGRKRVPPFFFDAGPWRTVPPRWMRRARTGADGKFRLDGIRPGRLHTLVIGEEATVVFGVAARREATPQAGVALAIRLTAEEDARREAVPDRATEANDALERVLFDLNLALGWIAEHLRHCESHAEGKGPEKRDGGEERRDRPEPRRDPRPQPRERRPIGS